MAKDTDVPAIQKAVRVIYDMSEDAKIREIARIREKAMHDEASALGNARQEGIEIGETKECSRIAENLRKSGISEEQIKQIINN